MLHHAILLQSLTVTFFLEEASEEDEEDEEQQDSSEDGEPSVDQDADAAAEENNPGINTS